MSQELLAISDVPNQNVNAAHHVAFLHSGLGQKMDDFYLIDAALALNNFGHKISVLTSSVEKENALKVLCPSKKKVNVVHSGAWIPNSVFGTLRQAMSRFRAFTMALRLVLLPPKPRPKLVILDTDTLALFILSFFGFYKTIYINHFPQLNCSEAFHSTMRFTTNLLTAKTIKFADGIIVQTKCLEEIFKRSYPNLKTPITVLPTCCDTGYWKEDVIDIRRIIPDLPPDYILFVIFCEYKKRSNFKLVLETLEQLFCILHPPLSQQIHFAIAGHCSRTSVEQNLFYKDLINKTKDKAYAPNITFLKQLPTVHKKTLLQACTAIIQPTKHDVYERLILAAMSMGKPVISVNSGFATDVLTHRLTGILIEPSASKFSRVIIKMATTPTLQSFIGQMARNNFLGQYSFEKFSEKINTVAAKLVQAKVKRVM